MTATRAPPSLPRRRRPPPLSRPLLRDPIAARLLSALAALRRRRPATVVEIRLALDSRSLTAGPRKVRLTPREWPLIAHLVAHPDHAISREEPIDGAWGKGGR